MNKLCEFVKTSCASSKILFAIWFLLALFVESTEQSKFVTIFKMGIVFLSPAVMTELRKNSLFENCDVKAINIFRNTKIISRILIYLWLVCVIFSGVDVGAFLCFSIFFLLPVILIEYNINPIIKMCNKKGNEMQQCQEDSIQKETDCLENISKTEEIDRDLMLMRMSVIDALKKIMLKKANDENKICNSVTSLKSDKESVNNNSSYYSDVIVQGTEEKTQPIPQINVKTAEKQTVVAQKEQKYILTEDAFKIKSDYKSLYHPNKFIDDMKRFENKTGKQTIFVPFMQYYPSYDSMDKRQKDWYFYWRSQVRKGEYLATDLSYIFLHVYELLSGYGYKSAEDGYNQLYDLWTNYRNEYPKLDRYLLVWLFDFAQLHNLDFNMPEWVDISMLYQPEIKNIIIDKHSSEIPLKLPFVLIDSLCDYSLARSKFYNDGNQLLMNEVIPRVVALADVALFKKNGKGLLRTYGPSRPKKQIYYIFQGVNCSYSNKRIDIVAKDYINNPKLRSYINELVRYAENVLRDLYNCRGRLRGVNLEAEMANLVQAFLEKEYSPQKKDRELIKKPEIKLDFDNIKELRNQSNAVRDALEVPEEISETKELLTDLQSVKEIFWALPPYCRMLIDELQKNAWEIIYDSKVQTSIEKINELSEKELACDILVVEGKYLILEDDYRDELDYIYEHLKEIDMFRTNAESKDNAKFDLSILSKEMKELFQVLSPTQEEIVCIILTQNNISEYVNKIANEQMSMPEILIDELNDIASQYIGDILIDTFGDEMCILEQYENELKKAMK